MTQKKFTTLFATLPLTVLFIIIIFCSIVSNIHNKLLSIAGETWEDYRELKNEPVKPTCDAESFIAQPVAENKDDQDKGGSDAEEDDDAIDFDALLGKEEPVSEEALNKAKEECQASLVAYERIVEKRNSTGLKVFSAVEKAVGTVANNASKYKAHFLILVFLFCSFAATLNRQHIGLRSPVTRREDRASQTTQLIGNLAVLISFIVYYYQQLTSGLTVVSNLPAFWIAAFCCMIASNAFLIVRPLDDPPAEGEQSQKSNSLLRVFLGIPLYAYMAVICCLYFMLIELHPSGVAIYLNKMTENPDNYTNVALYVFCGMMLKNTTIADKFLALIRPWKLSPELLVFVIVLGSAFPTAYSGASGIFVIAAGAIIYREFKKSGMRDSLALAGTAMSGSMGIVLSPCLLVVIIAALNKEVTSAQLYGAGIKVFFVNIAILAMVLFATARSKLSCANPIVAIPQMLKNCVPILPHVVIGAVVIFFFSWILGTDFNEYTAPYILPFMLLCMLVYDRVSSKRAYAKLAEEEREKTEKPQGIGLALLDSANSTAYASGALLSLMGMSVCLGGILDRAKFSSLFPAKFSSSWIAMIVLVIILVIIGMIMDPYGAVILVSATMKQIASANGIGAVHFWLVVMCAFELGYLTPPVALNQLLTRQVVGEEAFAYEDSPDRPKKFWQRHERIVLPIAVKGTVLLLIAFVPLLLDMLSK